MTPEDFDVLRGLAPFFAGFRSIGLLSPWREFERKLFPKATALPRWRWDLNRPGTRRFDLLVASNVFMYSPDPARWFRHVLASCRYFLMLDPVRRKRSPDGELGPDDDRVRYAIGDARPRVEASFDLGRLEARLLGHRTYFGGANPYDLDPLHVAALFRGDLADPILRIDDYPTGIRPILSDLSPLHDVLRRVEARGLAYHLGIVPALLTEEMWSFLRTLRHVIPTVHGYDHAYPRYSQRLVERNDPYNEHTIGVFNEFRGQPYDVVLGKLRDGRRLLEDRLGKPVEAYIPPCNLGDRSTGRALVEAGYGRYLSEKRIPGCALPWIRSDFAGRSSEFDQARDPDVIALHVTWEWDLVRAGKTQPLDRLLDRLAARRDDERDRGQRLSAAVTGGGNGA